MVAIIIVASTMTLLPSIVSGISNPFKTNSNAGKQSISAIMMRKLLDSRMFIARLIYLRLVVQVFFIPLFKVLNIA